MSFGDPAELQIRSDLDRKRYVERGQRSHWGRTEMLNATCMLLLSRQPMASEGSRPNPKELGHVVLL